MQQLEVIVRAERFAFQAASLQLTAYADEAFGDQRAAILAAEYRPTSRAVDASTVQEWLTVGNYAGFY